MSKPRREPNLTIKLAATLLALRMPNEKGEWEPIISHEHAKLMSAEQIISLFQFHHTPIPHAEGGPDEPWNLEPWLIVGHRVQTRTKDVPQIAKNKRISAAHQEFVSRVLTIDKKPRETSSRFAKGRKLQSRDFDKKRRA